MAGSIPDLDSDLLSIDYHFFDLEISSDSWSVLARELGLVGEPIYQLRLANSGVAYDDHLDNQCLLSTFHI